MIRSLMVATGFGLLVCACNPGGGAGPQQGVVSPALDSGVTSSNGGGQRATGGQAGVSIGPGGAASTGAPNARGNTY